MFCFESCSVEFRIHCDMNISRICNVSHIDCWSNPVVGPNGLEVHFLKSHSVINCC